MRYGGNTTCVQIQIKGHDELLILDSGTGFRNLGNELQGRGSSLRGRVFITHPHWDHLQGFPFFKPFYNGNNWFRIYLPPQGEIGCKEILQGHMSSTFFPVSIDMLEADLDCETFQPGKRDFDGYSVEYMWATHTVPTAMYRIRVKDKTIIFAPDNELMNDGTNESQQFREAFKEYIRGADVLIHDAQYSKKLYNQRVGWGHSAWETVAELAKEVNVKRLFLTHHDPDNSDDVLAKREEQIQDIYGASFERVCLAKEGQEIALPSG
ncbi:MBL fold metallo-hydrolase [Gracilimonas sp.]|uniref:MBL fold metallo-hydrolase n=1 Tax=Gracilimonas sp. TaxID=1974203 RepID=UPI003BAC9287